MKYYCDNHPKKVALSFCRICKKYYCKECLNEGDMYYYCNAPTCYNEYLKEKPFIDPSIIESYKKEPRFCPKCLEETLPETAGNLETVNFVGTQFKNVGLKCNICNSYVVEKCYIILGIITKYYGLYRVIELESDWMLAGTKTKFISRKVKVN